MSPRLIFTALAVVSCFPVRAWSQAGNDQFANRLPLSGSSATAVSNLRTATHETGEPDHAAGGGSRSLWWTWTAPASGPVNFSTFGGTLTPARYYTRAFQRSLAVYTGSSPAALSEITSGTTLVSPDSSYVTSALAGPSLSTPVVAGTVYQIAVDGPAVFDSSDDGTVVLAINQAPTIYSPAGGSATTGTAYTYAIQASNNPASFDATNLPPGLSVNPSSGVLSGTLTAAGTYSIGLAATNPGGTATATLSLAVTNPAPASTVRTAPIFSNSAAAGGTVGSSFSISLYASGSPTGYAATSLPDGLTLDVNSGSIAGTPTTAGTYAVPVSATNAAGTGNAVLTIVITAGPRPPVITSSLAASGTVGTSFNYYPALADTSAPAKPTSYSASNLPPGLGFNTSTGYLQGTPSMAGIFSVPIAAANAGGTGSAVVTVTVAPVAAPVAPVAAPPQLNSSAAASGVAGAAFTYQMTASNAPTGFTAANLPPGLSLNTRNGFLTGTPAATGSFSVPVTAFNDYGSTAATLTITIAATATTSSPSGTAPVITSPAAAGGYIDRSLSYQIYPPYYYGSGSLTYKATGLPPGLGVDPVYGYISGTPTVAGTYATTISAIAPSAGSYSSSGYYGTGSAVVTFVIGATAPAPATPVIGSAAAATPGTAGSTYVTYSITASGSPASYAASGLPPGLTLSSSGYISGTPTTAGNYPVTVSATNAAGTGSATVMFLVNAAAAATTAVPLIGSYATASGTVGSSFSYSISGSNTPTSYGAGSLPAGLSFSASSGYITGTPAAAGVYTVPVSATNAGGTANATLTTTITGTAASPMTPVVSSAISATGSVGASFTYTILAANSPTSFDLGASLPSGLSFTPATGKIAGIPTTAGTYSLPVTATNAAGTGRATITLLIAAKAAAAPVITSDAAANMGINAPFYYYLTATNGPTSFGASGLPTGLSLNSATGLISGTGPNSGTSIYSVTVTATNSAGQGSATLSLQTGGVRPQITSACAAAGVAGTTFTYSILSNFGTGSYTASNLPPGLSVNASTGKITGTPTTVGTYASAVTDNTSSGTATAAITFFIFSTANSKPVVSSSAGVGGAVGDPFYYFASATNTPASWSAGNLPTGLSIDAVSGLISGKPTTAGNYSVSLAAANASGSTAATLKVSIDATYNNRARLSSPVGASATIGTAFSYIATTNQPSNSSFSASGLPAGLTYDYYAATISGTPTGTPGNYLASLYVYTSQGPATGYVAISVGAATSTSPVLNSAAAAAGVVGAPVNYTLTASNTPSRVRH